MSFKTILIQITQVKEQEETKYLKVKYLSDSIKYVIKIIDWRSSTKPAIDALPFLENRNNN